MKIISLIGKTTPRYKIINSRTDSRLGTHDGQIAFMQNQISVISNLIKKFLILIDSYKFLTP